MKNLLLLFMFGMISNGLYCAVKSPKNENNCCYCSKKITYGNVFCMFETSESNYGGYVVNMIDIKNISPYLGNVGYVQNEEYDNQWVRSHSCEYVTTGIFCNRICSENFYNKYIKKMGYKAEWLSN